MTGVYSILSGQGNNLQQPGFSFWMSEFTKYTASKSKRANSSSSSSRQITKHHQIRGLQASSGNWLGNQSCWPSWLTVLGRTEQLYHGTRDELSASCSHCTHFYTTRETTATSAGNDLLSSCSQTLCFSLLSCFMFFLLLLQIEGPAWLKTWVCEPLT